MNAPTTLRQHAINWFEIPCEDFDRATSFYETILDAPMQRVQDETKLAESDTSPAVAERQAELDRLKKRYQDLQKDVDALLQAH